MMVTVLAKRSLEALELLTPESWKRFVHEEGCPGPNAEWEGQEEIVETVEKLMADLRQQLSAKPAQKRRGKK